MIKKIILSFGVSAIGVLAFTQNLYMPRNVLKAYENGTRAWNGEPGKNYWQNKGVYDIQMSFQPETRIVKGFETIQYTNNSPDTLKTLAIRFVNNVHKPTAPHSGNKHPDFFTTGLEIYQLKVNDIAYNVDAGNWGTVQLIPLKTAILPNSTTKIAIEWSYPVSKESEREGQIDSTSFFIGYSFPRVSVYDDYNGWDLLPHITAQEFYNDFNDYTFSVTVPKNYVVWATGDLLNPREVLQPKIADRLIQSYTSDSIFNIASKEEMAAGQVTAQKEMNTWKFVVKHITDITFAVSNHYVWDAGSTIVDNTTKRRASMQAAYAHTASDFKNSVRWGKHTLQYYSNVLPGIPYPYSKMTAFHGYGDMEFPMMVNDESVPNDSIDARMLQDHEIAHTYFPFYMGINETRYAFMDEGWAVFFTYILSRHLFGAEKGDAILSNSRIKRWNTDISTEMDMPLITMSSQLSGKAYRSNSYNKSVAAYLALQALLGESLFKKCLHHYMERWNGKHPIPWDFFFSFNTASGKNLNAFWNNWFFSNGYIDVKVVDVKQNMVTVKNVGGLYIPTKVIAHYSSGKVVEQKIYIDDWINLKNSRDASITIRFPQRSKDHITKVILDNGVFVDATEKDNIWVEQ